MKRPPAQTSLRKGPFRGDAHTIQHIYEYYKYLWISELKDYKTMTRETLQFSVAKNEPELVVLVVGRCFDISKH